MNPLERVIERIASKQQDYARYDFSAAENDALKTFFDLSQEFTELEDFFALCVGIPKTYFGLNARFYLMHEKLGRLALVAQSDEAELPPQAAPPDGEWGNTEGPVLCDGRLLVGVRGKSFLMDELPFRTHDGLIGLLEVFPIVAEEEHRIFFLRKFGNRIGYNLHNKFLAIKNEQHLKFIRTLVMDIEHNIIVPNMIFRLYLRQLKARLQQNTMVEEQFRALLGTGASASDLQTLLAALAEVNQGLSAEFEHIDRHYTDMSLFLETLLRRSHFDQGRLIPRTKLCNLKREVVVPQLDRFRDQFADRGIRIDDRFSGLPDEELIGVVDVGLLSQVYANLFSNAMKYTEAIITESGQPAKYISYGREILPNYYGEGCDGVKYNVFSTGSHLAPEEREHIYDEGVRAANATDQPGSGHGLSFVRNVIEIHGGVVGYEPTEYGNNFYFILPGDSV